LNLVIFLTLTLVCLKTSFHFIGWNLHKELRSPCLTLFYYTDVDAETSNQESSDSDSLENENSPGNDGMFTFLSSLFYLTTIFCNILQYFVIFKPSHCNTPRNL
jgi:hypothetical protein